MKGFALIEVLMTLFIVSFALFAISGMQMTALAHSQEAYLRTVASLQLSAMMERLRFNQLESYRASELVRWNTINARLLPHAKGSYHCSGNRCEVILEWWIRSQAEHISLAAVI